MGSAPGGWRGEREGVVFPAGEERAGSWSGGRDPGGRGSPHPTELGKGCPHRLTVHARGSGPSATAPETCAASPEPTVPTAARRELITLTGDLSLWELHRLSTRGSRGVRISEHVAKPGTESASVSNCLRTQSRVGARQRRNPGPPPFRPQWVPCHQRGSAGFVRTSPFPRRSRPREGPGTRPGGKGGLAPSRHP